MGEGYARGTIKLYVRYFCHILKVAKKQKYFSGDLSLFGNISNVKVDEKRIEVYLNEGELQALYEMPLSGRQEVSRDMFLIGCYTAQGFADASSINKSNFDGDIIRLKRKKTGTSARIRTDLPFKHNNLIALMEKYGYCAPEKVYGQKVNDDIKVILKELSKTMPSLAEPCVTILTKTEKDLEKAGKRKYVHLVDKNGKVDKNRVIKPKYECVSTHTARRSGITNLVLTGNLDNYDIQNIAGHKSVKQTEGYCKATGDDIAERLTRKTDKESVSKVLESMSKKELLEYIKNHL